MMTPLSFNSSKYDSLEAMLKDKSYCKWLMQQAWFQKREEYQIVKLLFEKHNPIRVIKKGGTKFTPHDQRPYPIGKYKGFVPYSLGLYWHICDGSDLNKEMNLADTTRLTPTVVRSFYVCEAHYQENKIHLLTG